MEAFTRIPNKILDQWMAALSGSAFKVVLFVARKTYGWHKEATGDRLSTAQIVAGTGLVRSVVIKTCAALSRAGALLVTRPDNTPNSLKTYRVNPDWFGDEASVNAANTGVELPPAGAEIAPGSPNYGPGQTTDPSEIRTTSGVKYGPPPVRNTDPQKKLSKRKRQRERPVKRKPSTHRNLCRRRFVNRNQESRSPPTQYHSPLGGNLPRSLRPNPTLPPLRAPPSRFVARRPRFAPRCST